MNSRGRVGVGIGLALLAAAAPAEQGRYEISRVPVVITNPGSYVLTCSPTWTTPIQEGSAIQVEADNVTIDLNGFAVDGAAGEMGGSAILQVSNRRGLRILNGTVYGSLGGALFSWAGIRAAGDGTEIRGVTATHNDIGIVVGPNARVVNCMVSSNVQDGMLIGANSLVAGGMAMNNGDDGFRAGNGCVLRRCRAEGNTACGFNVDNGCQLFQSRAEANASNGVLAKVGAVVRECVAYNNQFHGFVLGAESQLGPFVAAANHGWGVVAGPRASVQDGIVRDNAYDGIRAQADTVVRRCVVTGNEVDGIVLDRRCRAEDNLCVSNYYAGIYVTNTANQLLGNHLLWNRWGIEVRTNNNMVFKNSASRNISDDYQVVNGNRMAPVITNNPAHTSPWANWSY